MQNVSICLFMLCNANSIFSTPVLKFPDTKIWVVFESLHLSEDSHFVIGLGTSQIAVLPSPYSNS